MIFKRKIYDKLLEWKKTARGEKALLIEGARRIGKSTIAEEFGKREYKSYILIDFNDASKVVFDAFDKVPNILWEEEYQKYMDVLDKYKNIKVARWSQN